MEWRRTTGVKDQRGIQRLFDLSWWNNPSMGVVWAGIWKTGQKGVYTGVLLYGGRGVDNVGGVVVQVGGVVV